MNYIKDVLGLDKEDIREIESTFFECFQDINIVREFNKQKVRI